VTASSERVSESRSSIALRRGMNGKYGWEIHVYFDPGEPSNDHHDALDLLAEIDSELRQGYEEKP
jgi:hypothetical protein